MIRDKIRTFWATPGNRVSLVLLVGLLLFIAHYATQPFLKYLFLPQIGAALIIGSVFTLLLTRWESLKKVGLGPKMLWIPLSIITASAVLRLLVQRDMLTLAGALFMVGMFALYMVSRQYGERTLRFFLPVVVIGAVSVIIDGIISRTTGNSGLFNNYCTAVEFLVFGWVVTDRKHQWWLAAIVITALFFSGAPEALLYVAGIGLLLLIRRDWSKKILLPVGVLGLIILVGIPTGFTQILWGRTFNMLDMGYAAISDDSLTVEQRDEMLNDATNSRWLYTWRLQRPVSPLGYGVDITNKGATDGIHIPHNIALLVTDQLGPVAAGAWIVAMVAGMIKTKRKYGFLALLLFGVFQPFVWTLMAPYMWVMAGASATGSSYVFKK